MNPNLSTLYNVRFGVGVMVALSHYYHLREQLWHPHSRIDRIGVESFGDDRASTPRCLIIGVFCHTL